MKQVIKPVENQLLPAISAPLNDANDASEKQLSLFHDLRNSVSTINFTAHFLSLKDIPGGERVQYLDVLTRNLTSIEAMIVTLADIARHQKSQSTPVSTSTDVIHFLRRIYAQLPSFAPKECQDQLEHIRQLIEGLI